MTRKDTILVAVVINAGLLAILFATAIIYDDTDREVEQTELVATANEPKSLNKQENPSALIASATTGDEVDHVLRQYQQPSTAKPIAVETTDVFTQEPVTVQAYRLQEEEYHAECGQGTNCVDIIVKKGDSLDKIARQNKTTVAAIKKANQLQNEKLSIGQSLKVPVKKELSSPLVQNTPSSTISRNENENSSAVYYVVKSGDSPWKIAKQFNVKYDDILKLNHLDEEKARNLKVGDRIRVK